MNSVAMRAMRGRFALAAFVGIATVVATPSQAQTNALERLESGAKRLVAPVLGKTDSRLQQVARFEHQVTGVTVSEHGRTFVNFPRWSEDVPVSVAEVMEDGSIKAYPNDDWNSWRNARMGQITPNDHFVCVQSVVADGRGSLWILDPAAPNTEHVVKDGPKLVQVDLVSNSVKRVIAIPDDVAGPASYLNDVRFAPDGSFAYMTDFGSPGGLVVLDLASGKAWRAMSGDASTQAEPNVEVKTDGNLLLRPDGRQPMFNADGIALSSDGKTLYWQALTGKTLYKIDTEVLKAARDNPDATKGKFEKVANTEPVDGLWMDKSGRLYLSAFGEDAIKMLGADGTLKTVITDSRLRWPDTFSQGPDGSIYITASHIQDSPWFHPAGWADKNFALFKFAPPDGEPTGTSR